MNHFAPLELLSFLLLIVAVPNAAMQLLSARKRDHGSARMLAITVAVCAFCLAALSVYGAATGVLVGMHLGFAVLDAGVGWLYLRAAGRHKVSE